MRLLAASLMLLPVLAFAVKPEKNYYLRPDSLNLAYRETRLNTPDGAELFTWVLPTKAPKSLRTTLVLAYGDAGNMSSTLFLAKALLAAGFDLLLFDYRGFGHSSAFPMDSTRLYYNEFATDLDTALRAARREFPANRLGVWSLSMGTVVATLCLQKSRVDFLIADNYVQSPVEMVDLYKGWGKTVTLPDNAERYPAMTPKLTCPILFFGGIDDDVTTLSDARAVAAQRPNRRVVTYRGWHGEATKALTRKTYADRYVADIVRFVQRG